MAETEKAIPNVLLFQQPQGNETRSREQGAREECKAARSNDRQLFLAERRIAERRLIGVREDGRREGGLWRENV